MKWLVWMGVRKSMSLNFRTIDNATYAVPAGRVFVSNHSITFPKVCPCIFAMVVAYPGKQGNFGVGFLGSVIG